jgi:dihydropyrimidine dehydrogenase (NAD+) subunit PreA
MPDLSCDIAGIKSPNPFWLASGPPTNTAYQVCNAFEAGWGGAVWKTITDEPIVNVASRYGGIALNNQKLMGLNNIELISDRALEDNLADIRQVKRRFPKHPVVASVMVQSKRDAWHRIVKRAQDAGVDGIELNFGCPHGMNERGMGSAVGQVPEYAEMICAWVKEVASVPVLAKLTPNVTDITAIARAVKRGGADGISLINTVSSIIGVDLDSFSPRPSVGGAGASGGIGGPAIKPIAMYMVSQVARDGEVLLPVSGIGGIRKWEDAVEFLLLGAANVQICTAVMHRGFGIVTAMLRGLENWMTQKGFTSTDQFIGRASQRIKPWGDLDLNYKVVARINEATCIHCGICYASCEDGCYQAIDWKKLSRQQYERDYGKQNDARPAVGRSEAAPNLGLDESGRSIDVFTVNESACVGCNMCALACPVENCITMEEVSTGKPPMSWNEYQALLKSRQVAPIEPKKAVKPAGTKAGE